MPPPYGDGSCLAFYLPYFGADAALIVGVIMYIKEYLQRDPPLTRSVPCGMVLYLSDMSTGRLIEPCLLLERVLLSIFSIKRLASAKYFNVLDGSL